MSYDLRLAVKVEGLEEHYAIIAQPEYASPTYNIGEMFRKCTGWDFKQGEWYKVSEVLPNIKKGISELQKHEKKYVKYNSPNGWGTTESALKALESLLECIEAQSGNGWSWNDIPVEYMYVAW